MEILNFKMQMLLLLALVAQTQALGKMLSSLQSLFGSWKKPGKHETVRIHLENDEELIVPKDSTVKVLNEASSDKFYADLSNKLKEPKYLKHTPVVGKLVSSLDIVDDDDDFGKSCCGNRNEWNKDIAGLEELFRPVLLPIIQQQPPTFKFVPSAQLYEIPKSVDVKPVTEEIKDDLMYDFRTKTHSI